jgi:hypothetical protein
LSPELPDDREDRVLALACELDVLTLRDLSHLGALRDLALGLHREGRRAERGLLLRERVRQVVEPLGGRITRRLGRPAAGRGCPHADAQDDNKRSEQEREELLPHVSPLVKMFSVRR